MPRPRRPGSGEAALGRTEGTPLRGTPGGGASQVTFHGMTPDWPMKNGDFNGIDL